jgi:hypothetical protein
MLRDDIYMCFYAQAVSIPALSACAVSVTLLLGYGNKLCGASDFYFWHTGYWASIWDDGEDETERWYLVTGAKTKEAWFTVSDKRHTKISQSTILYYLSYYRPAVYRIVVCTVTRINAEERWRHNGYSFPTCVSRSVAQRCYGTREKTIWVVRNNTCTYADRSG